MAKIKKSGIKIKWYKILIVKFYWLIIIFVFIAAFLIEYFIIINPSLSQLRPGGELDLVSRREILETQRQYLIDLKQLAKESEEINRAELEKINYVLAKNVNVPEVLKQIEILANQSGLELESFSYNFEQESLFLRLNFGGGSYAKAKQYLKQIEKNIRIMDVRNIALTKVGNGLSINLQSYYLD